MKEFEHLLLRENAVEKMLGYWHGFESRYGVGLTLHDHVGAFIMPDGLKLLPGINEHRFPCCSYRKQKRMKCMAHCRKEAMEKAAREGKPFCFRCWRGVTELVMPLYRGKTHAATIFAGAFRDPAFDISGFSSRYRKLYEAMAEWPQDGGAELETLLVGAGYSLLRIADNLRGEYESEPGRKGVIRRFFLRRHAEPVGVRDLAGELGISESRTLHLLRELFGKGFSRLLTEERIARAEQLLGESRLPLREIARTTGFQNEFYFSRVFKKLRGLPPGALRVRESAEINR